MNRNYTDGYSEWQSNPEIVAVNCLPQRASFMHYNTFEQAAECDGFASPRLKLLNGKWKFKLYENYAYRPSDFAQPLYDTHNWDTVIVPASWQALGYGVPQYCNIRYEWEGHEDICPPNAPRKYNPVGCYVKRFHVKEEALSQNDRFVLCFEGVESAFYLHINGERIGYAESSFNRHEFDISRYLVAGSNVIGVEVYSSCTGSWLECQDFWRFGGIFRDVYLYSTKREYIRDFKAVALPSNDYNDGSLKLTVKINGSYEGLGVEMTVLDENGDMVARDNRYADEDHCAELDTVVCNAKLWSAEKPNLYTVVLCLKDNGIAVEYVSTRVGFRSVEISDGIIKINGKRAVFKGVNRHEFTPDKGRYVSKEIMLADIIALKRNNINAVRTSHYPNDPKWLELCDEYGIYVIDENNMETHATKGVQIVGCPELPGNRREWEAACMARIKALYERDKNHACVVAWSLGNESSGGEIVHKMYNYLKKADSTRFVHFENQNAPDEGENSDVHTRMYSKPSYCEQYAKDSKNKKPMILCEYSHSMGNSCGSTKEYTDLWYKYKKLQGGFVWDFVDQTLFKTDEDGTQFLAHGGDFDSQPNDGNFCANGLLFGDRQEKPQMAEIKKLYQNVEFVPIDPERGVFKVINHFDDTALDEFEFCWEQLSLGERLRGESMVISVPPGGEATIDLELNKIISTEWYLNLYLRLSDNTKWADKGHIVAWEQFVVHEFELDLPELSGDTLLVSDTYGSLKIVGDKISVRFDRRSGLLSSIKFDENDVLETPLKLNFWRALTDNDKGNFQQVRLGCWRHAGECAQHKIDGYKQLDGGKTVIVTTSASIHTVPECQAIVVFTITAKGVVVDLTMVPSETLPEIPEVGFQFNLCRELDNVKYLAMGPGENYIDRRSGAKLDVYECKVDDFFVNYITPQEHGHRTGVRFAEFSKAKHGVRFSAMPQFSMNVSRYTVSEIENAEHIKDLPQSRNVAVRIASRQMGVGGYDSWGAHVNEKYKNLANRQYKLKFAISAI